MAKSALEMMLPGLLKALGLEPDTVQKTIENVGQVVVEIRDRLARIEVKLDASVIPASSAALQAFAMPPEPNLGDQNVRLDGTTRGLDGTGTAPENHAPENRGE